MKKKNLMEISQEIFDFETRESLTAEEQTQLKGLKAEYEAQMRELNIKGAQRMLGDAPQMDEQNEQLREFLRNGKNGQVFELREPGTAMSDVSGVIPTNIQKPLDSVIYGNTAYDLAGAPIVYGASGLASWPFFNHPTVSIQSELVSLGNAQKLTATNVTETQQRVTCKVLIDNQAIENSAIDLVAEAKKRIAAAYKETIGHAAVSTAKWNTNFYGGFAHTSKQTGTYSTFNYATAMEMVGLVAAKDYNIERGVFVMGAADFYALKATSRDTGSGLMVIDDNNRIGGFPVLLDNNINRTAVKGAISGHNVGFGLFEWLPALQHGNVRLSVDGTSATAADVDGVYVTCNADWSMTDLYPDAFVLYSKSE